ncbi:hypothetical protein PR048_026456 [Dryococelus australis]|uniref:Reverse transcriptase RNase H-like domain-containing protein n=1 Tax=Dryococelus australis TaxID=614101 RepID=A0ABQ9GLF1_9NEOP|nr:hypothetical protein PR048_026456 [Dryococelus australis]
MKTENMHFQNCVKRYAINQFLGTQIFLFLFTGVVMGAVLTQIVNGMEHPIYYISRQFNHAERNYSVTERECLSVVFALKNDVTIYMVENSRLPLRWLLQTKEPTSRLARWSLQLSEYDFDVIHKAGKTKTNADTLSRISVQLVAPPYAPVWGSDLIKKDQKCDPHVINLEKRNDGLVVPGDHAKLKFCPLNIIYLLLDIKAL